METAGAKQQSGGHPLPHKRMGAALALFGARIGKAGPATLLRALVAEVNNAYVHTPTVYMYVLLCIYVCALWRVSCHVYM